MKIKRIIISLVGAVIIISSLTGCGVVDYLYVKTRQAINVPKDTYYFKDQDSEIFFYYPDFEGTNMVYNMWINEFVLDEMQEQEFVDIPNYKDSIHYGESERYKDVSEYAYSCYVCMNAIYGNLFNIESMSQKEMERKFKERIKKQCSDENGWSDLNFKSIKKTKLDEVTAVKVEYTAKSPLNYEGYYIDYFYDKNDSQYCLYFAYDESKKDTYEPIVESIINSVKIGTLPESPTAIYIEPDFWEKEPVFVNKTEEEYQP